MANHPRVLVVDDEQIARVTIEALLASENYELHFANDGLQALTAAGEIQPDIILLDIMMPGMNGFEVCRRIRSTPGLSDTPIILITALSDMESRMSGIKAGADDFLTKPFDYHELLLRMQTMTRLRQYKQQSVYNSIELKFHEAFINEQNSFNDLNTIQLNALKNISEYVEADESIFILFDLEKPELATKKHLEKGGDDWHYEETFLIKGSKLCSEIPHNIAVIEYNFPSFTDKDVLFNNVMTNPVRSIIFTPLHANNTFFGAMVFTNPLFTFNPDDNRTRFLQLMVRSVANAIFAFEHNRQLMISKAELEASQWEIINSRNTLRTFFDNIPTCVYIIDRSYTIMAINSRRSERAGKPTHTLVGGKCYEVLYGKNSPCPLCRVADAFNGVPAVRNLREWGPRETFVQWEITTIPIKENTDQINRAIIFDEDITEKWILEANLIQSEKLASIGQLAANVAHEINNPLAAIIANAQLLLRDMLDADADTVESLKLIETAGVRAAKIVGNLLESARREKREEFEEISLNDTILDAISMVNFEIKKRGVTIKLNLDKKNTQIVANRNQLKGVWINLIMNALGAIDHAKGVITITSRYENNEFRLAFADNGKGILPEFQDHVFEPFFTTKEVGKGTGLGLYVSQQVIKEHLGEIHFETKPGKGTKFIIILPDSRKTEE